MTPDRRCDFCNNPLPRHPSAPHQRFCSAHCRSAWHGKRRDLGARLLAERERQERSELHETTEFDHLIQEKPR